MPSNTSKGPTDTQGHPLLDWERIDDLPEPARIVDYLRRAAAATINADDKSASLDRMDPSGDDVVLDLGCGVGVDVVAAARRINAGGLSVGVDRSQVLVGAADRSAERGRYVVGDLHALPFADRSFDGVHCERTLQHVSDPVRVIDEMVRVLRSGGTAVVSEPDYRLDFWDHPMQELTARVLEAQWLRIRNATIGRHLPRLFVLAGLSDVQVEIIPFHWLVTEAGTFGTTLAYAVHDAAISQAEADTWTQRLHEVAADAPVLTGCIRFRVTGNRE